MILSNTIKKHQKSKIKVKTLYDARTYLSSPESALRNH